MCVPPQSSYASDMRESNAFQAGGHGCHREATFYQRGHLLRSGKGLYTAVLSPADTQLGTLFDRNSCRNGVGLASIVQDPQPCFTSDALVLGNLVRDATPSFTKTAARRMEAKAGRTPTCTHVARHSSVCCVRLAISYD